MTEIKDLIIKIIEEAPHLAIWVLIIIYGYKVILIGSMYGLVKFIVNKICETIKDNRNTPKAYKTPRGVRLESGAKNILDDFLKLKQKEFHPFITASEMARELVEYGHEEN